MIITPNAGTAMLDFVMHEPMAPTNGTSEDPYRLLSPAEAAYFLGAISERSLYRLMRRGDVPHKRVGDAIRFPLWGLRNYASRDVSTTWQRGPRGRPERAQAR